MGWTAPRDWAVGEVVTEAMMDAQVSGNLSYLKGIGQVPTIQSGLTIDNSLGSERLLLPLLSTAECTTVLNAEGEVAFDEQTHRVKIYDNDGVESLVSTADVDDTAGGTNAATTTPISSNVHYDHCQAADPHTGYVLESLADAQGDTFYASADNTWAKLTKGTEGQVLRQGATIPEWASAVATQEIFIPCNPGGAEVSPAGDHVGYLINAAADAAAVEFYIPHDFSSITSAVAVRIAMATATHRLNYTSDYGALGEAYNTHSESLDDQDTAETDTLIYEQDISGILSAIAAGDYVGVVILGDATNIPNDLILGIRFRYT